MRFELFGVALTTMAGAAIGMVPRTGMPAALRPTIMAAVLAGAALAFAQPAAAASDTEPLDVQQLFASTCGWCHSDAGRVAGKGPQLMDSPRSDDFLRNRIKLGKPGAMPAFGEAFTDAQIDAIIVYIRALKPD
ncbi:c-type cytochrome [Bradyrhizobium oligotrophicum]|uniref:c-type cytochrome n=1 Tax=Bradyrhizobium oligotrophicum TaxID=44255 RepID=UPI003EBF2C61